MRNIKEETKIIPTQFLDAAIQAKKELGGISAYVLIRRLKITHEKAKEILNLLN